MNPFAILSKNGIGFFFFITYNIDVFLFYLNMDKIKQNENRNHFFQKYPEILYIYD